MVVNFSHFNSILSIFKHFRTKQICISFLEKQRWADGVVCPYCGRKHTAKRKDGRHICLRCNRSFSVLVGTVFENTKLPLNKWFAAMYLLSAHPNGISSCQIARDINVTQKTAWYLLHKIRTLYEQDDTRLLSGEVECDEMYLGGRETNKHKSHKTIGTQGRSTKTKTPIFGMVEYKKTYLPNGKKQVDTFVRAMKVPDTKSETLLPIISNYVEQGSAITTDELSSYLGLGKEREFSHNVIKHSQDEYVVGNITTNHIEGFWGGLKRMVFATYHFVSRGYLQRYLDEACFRYNTRKLSVGERFSIMLAKSVGKCVYSQVRLIKHKE